MTSSPDKAATAADAHAMIVTSDGVRAPSGRSIVGKPVDSIDKLFKLLDYRELTAAGLPPQVWIIDAASLAPLGWGPDDVDPGSLDDYTNAEVRAGKPQEDVVARLDEATRTLLATHVVPDGVDGWHLFEPASGSIGHHIRLSRTKGRDRYMVDVILEPWAWTVPDKRDRLGIIGSASDGTAIAEDASEMETARELARRLTWHVAHVGVLPAGTPARTGAVLADRVYRDRTRLGKGIVVSKPGKMPPIDLGGDKDELEPVPPWARVMRTEDADNATRVVTIDQTASFLATAGMINLGYGEVACVAGDEAVAAAVADVRPFGVWRVVLPAAQRLALPELLPLPHPRMRVDRDVQTWVTTESLRTLTESVASGGAGLELDDLGIDEAWLFEHQGLVLRRWKEMLTDARKAAVEQDDRVMKQMVSDIYKGYIGRMTNPELWQQTKLVHHHQPLWRASIIAQVRHRSRVKATHIAAEHGLWPLANVTDSWTYLVSEGIDVADALPYLGKYTVEKDSPLDDAGLLALLAATSGGETRAAISAIHAAAADASMSEAV